MLNFGKGRNRMAGFEALHPWGCSLLCQRGSRFDPDSSPFSVVTVAHYLGSGGYHSLRIEQHLRRSLSQEVFPADPGLLAGLLIGITCVRSFTCAHEAVACTFVNDRFKRFACGLHLRLGCGKSGTNSCIVTGVKTVNRSCDSGHGILVRGAAVENESAAKIAAIRGKAKTLPAAPTEARYEQLAIRCGKILGIIGNAVEIRGDLLWTEIAYRFHNFVLCYVGCASTVRGHSRKQVGSHGDITSGSHLIGKVLYPVRHAKDLVNEKNDRSLVLALWVHDKS